MTSHHPYRQLLPRDPELRTVQVVIETPQGCRNKYEFDPKLGLFKLSHVLPAGASFPLSFGFIPNTLGGDGDPIDILVLADEPVPQGCVVDVRLIGILEAVQIGKDGPEENDRLVGVATESRDHSELHSLKAMNPQLRKELEYFFISYNRARGRGFELRDYRGPARAKKALRKAMKKAKAAAPGEGSSSRARQKARPSRRTPSNQPLQGKPRGNAMPEAKMRRGRAKGQAGTLPRT